MIMRQRTAQNIHTVSDMTKSVLL